MQQKPFFSYDFIFKLTHDTSDDIIEETLKDTEKPTVDDFYIYRSLSLYHDNTNIIVKNFEYKIAENITIELYNHASLGIYHEGRRHDNMCSYDVIVKEVAKKPYCDGAFSDLSKKERGIVYNNLDNILFEFIKHLSDGQVKYNKEKEYFECHLKGK